MDTISANTHFYKEISFFKNSNLWNGPYKNNNVGLFFICSVDALHMTYFVELNLLKLTTSITKFLYGNNTKVFNYNDLESFYNKLNILIRFALKDSTIAKVETWNCSRLDLACNFVCKNKEDKNTYLSAIKNSRFSRCKKDDYATSVHAHNKSTTYNIYDKNEEESNKGLSTTNKDLLRLEIQLKNSKLYRLFKSKKTVSEILENAEYLEELYLKELTKLGLNIIPTPLETTLNKIDNLINSNLIKEGIGNKLKIYILSDDKSTFSDSTTYRYNKILKNNNINPNYLQNKVSTRLDFNNFKLFSSEKSLDFLGLFMLLTYVKFLIMVINAVLPSINHAFNYYCSFFSNAKVYSIKFYNDS